MLKYKGCANFRARIAIATLSGKALRLDDIRMTPTESDAAVGLQDFEASYLRLIDELSDGCLIEVNETGTKLMYKPGILMGGKITHDCGTSRSIGWFLEGVLPLLLFCKAPARLTLTGLTNDCLDLSLDTIRQITLPLLKHFGVEEPIQLTIKRRGSPPKGGGVVELVCPVVRSLQSAFLVHSGKVRRIRGSVYCSKISPTVITRVIDASKAVLGSVVSDVFLNSDHHKGAEAGLSPGYSIMLMAESTTGLALGVERTAGSSSSTTGAELPEDVGQQAAVMMLEEMCLGGTIDRNHQPLALLLMVLGPEDVSKVRFGRQLTEAAVAMMRLIKDAFGVTFKLKKDVSEQLIEDEDSEAEEEEETDEAQTTNATAAKDKDNLLLSKRKQTNEYGTILVSCLGIGYVNMSRKIK